MAYYKTMVDPNGTGPLDHVEAYVDDEGNVYYPGQEGYVERNQSEADPTSEQVEAPVQQGQEKKGATVDPIPADPGSPLDIASQVDK